MKKKSRKKDIYTTGELNKLVDSICHPLFKEKPGFIFVDGLLHAMIEQNPPLSTKKFIKYNVPKLVEELKKQEDKF